MYDVRCSDTFNSHVAHDMTCHTHIGLNMSDAIIISRHRTRMDGY